MCVCACVCVCVRVCATVLKDCETSKKTVAKFVSLNNKDDLINLQKGCKGDLPKHWGCVQLLQPESGSKNSDSRTAWKRALTGFLKGEKKFKSPLQRGLVIPNGWRQAERRCESGCGHRLTEEREKVLRPQRTNDMYQKTCTKNHQQDFDT